MSRLSAPKLDGQALHVVALLVLAAAVTYVVWLDAWVSDDAVITFRYIDNLLHGHGPVFNVGERVQGYTHPLWFLLLTLITAFTHDEVYSAAYLGLALTFVTCVMLGIGLISLARDRLTGLVVAGGVLALLAGTDSWRTFQTGGLETSLAVLLLTLFCLEDARQPSRCIVILALGGLLVLCRPDLALIALPACVLALVQAVKTRRWAQGVAVAAPLVAWFVFARLYYGDFLPNTGAAKLGIFTFSQAVDQGWTYLQDWASNEPLTAAAALAGFVLTLARVKQPRDVLLPLGLVAYLVYVIVIGGDFMRGRFFVPLYVPCIVLGGITLARWLTLESRPLALGAAVALAVALAVATPTLEPSQGEARAIPKSGIVNERLYYWPGYSLAEYRKQNILINAAIGVSTINTFRNYIDACGSLTIHILNPSYFGYYVGPKLTAIDMHGLNDRYIAHLPNDYLTEHPPRVGHPEWKVPLKYLAGRGDISVLPDWMKSVEDKDCSLPDKVKPLLNDEGFVYP